VLDRNDLDSLRLGHVDDPKGRLHELTQIGIGNSGSRRPRKGGTASWRDRRRMRAVTLRATIGDSLAMQVWISSERARASKVQ